MRIIKSALLGTMIMGLGVFNNANAALEPDYNADISLGATPWVMDVTAQSKQADLNYIKNMRPHHAGALSMSTDYLNHPNANNPAFRGFTKGIIRNQKFEIMMLDRSEAHINALNTNNSQSVRGIVATQGLAQKYKFQRSPLPIIQGEIGVEEVRFSKAMIIHHQGAVNMCKAYINNQATDNQYLKLMCRDIIKDQNNDIAYMNDVIARYKGNRDNIKIDPSMVHGMDSMMEHGGTHMNMSHTGHH